MQEPSKKPLLGIALVALATAACQSSAALIATRTTSRTTTNASAVVATAARAPMELDMEQQSAWRYLAAKYDLDRDGRVTAEECQRDNFDRLDRNRDGVLTESDYAGGDSRMGAMRRGMRAQMVVIRFFQADDDVTELKRDELAWSVGEYDMDGNGAVDESEFRALSPEKMVEIPTGSGMGRMQPTDDESWAALTGGIDQDGNGVLEQSEFEHFFDRRDDGDGRWTLEQRRRPAEASAERGEPNSGPRVGTIAPDFTLTAPEGGLTSTLSSFRGNKPVALIFGSYT